METQLQKLPFICSGFMCIPVVCICLSEVSEALLLAGEYHYLPYQYRFWVMVVGLYRQARHTRRFELYISFLKCTCTLLLETSALRTCTILNVIKSNKWNIQLHVNCTRRHSP